MSDPARAQRRLAYGLIGVAFFDNLSLAPILAPYARDLGASPAWAGLILAGYSIANLSGNVIAGFALDRAGRRGPMLAGLAGTGLALLCYPAARTPATLLAVRMLHGAAAATLNPAAAAAIGDLSDPRDQARHAGRMGATIGLVALIAPPLGGVIVQARGAVFLFRFLAAVAFLAAAAAALGFRETRSRTDKPGARPGLRRLIRAPALRRAYLATLSFALALGAMTVHVPLSVRAGGGGPRVSGALFGWFSLIAVARMARVRRSQTAGADPAPRLGLALVAAALAAVWLGGAPGLWAGMTLFGLGFGQCFPATTANVQNAAPPGGRGAALGLLFGVYSAGVIAGQLAAGAGFGARAPVLVLLGLVPLAAAFAAGSDGPGLRTAGPAGPA